MNIRSKWLSLALVVAMTGSAAACGDGDATGPGSTPSVSLSLAVSGGGGATASALAAPAFDLALSDAQNNTLTITRVAMVLREIELERVEVVDCDVEPEPAGCESFEVGPRLFEFPLDGSVTQILTISGIEPGSYDELEIDVHKPSDDSPEDVSFLLAHPDFRDVSIRVEGQYNGSDFLFLTDLNEEQEIDLLPPLEITSAGSGSTNVTLTVDLSTWFRDATGGLIDPLTANKGGANENYVKDTIKASIDGFEDEDHDGEHD